MDTTKKEYTNGEVTIVWQPEKCIHSTNCWKGLPKAFDPKKRPWISLDEVNADEIMEQVLKCPSGALSIKKIESAEGDTLESVTAEVVIIPNGPIQLKGPMVITHKNGTRETKKEVFLCRCGQSSNKPFCDGTHRKCGFKDE